MSKILILASQHGDEYSGEKLYEYIKLHRPELLGHIEYLVANPEAHAQKVRYIESDMNRSYNGNHDTHEERLATKTLKYINDNNFDLVLDMHTTVTDQPPCLIIASVNPHNTRFIRAAAIAKIVIMNSDIVKTALNGVCSQAVSVEVNRDVDNELLESLCDDIDRYIRNEDFAGSKYIYDDTQLLHKSEVPLEEALKLKNFIKSVDGYYPILVGENAYGDDYIYHGFKAHKRYKFEHKV